MNSIMHGGNAKTRKELRKPFNDLQKKEIDGYYSFLKALSDGELMLMQERCLNHRNNAPDEKCEYCSMVSAEQFARDF